MNPIYQLSAPCLFGLESILKFEIQKIGGTNIQAENGRVTYEGDQSVLVRSNLWLRTAERVQIILASFTAVTFTELFDGVAEIPFEHYIDKEDEFPVKGWSIDSQLASVPSCQSIIKKSVVKRLESVYHIAVFPETGALHQITFSIHKDEVTVMMDTTGVTLHKRGYRKKANLAPIRETLAAGICDLARIRENDCVYDPMCGSGTLVIEAAQRALGIAPGLKRNFAFEYWSISKDSIWKQERKNALESVDSSVKFKAIASDIDAESIQTARGNARMAGVGDHITFERADIKNFAPKEEGIVLCNPPYGERLLETDEAQALFSVMGKVMKKRKGMSYYIIAPPNTFEPSFGRKADKRRKLYNGMIPSQLYMYFR